MLSVAPPAKSLGTNLKVTIAAFLRSRQRESSPMMSAALYQQRPAPEDGDHFRGDSLKPYESLPPRETLRVDGGLIMQ